MYDLGHTCSTSRRDYLLHTPDAFVRTLFPGLAGGMAVVHISTAGGAAFLQASIELEPGGLLAESAVDGIQRFVYVVSGSVVLAADVLDPDSSQTLGPGGFAYIPANTPHTLTATAESVLQLIDKPFVALAGAPPPTILTGNEFAVPPTPHNDDHGVLVRSLLPATLTHDFTVNTMTYAPGASLPQVEIHYMEHGLLMLEGGGIYRLAGDWYPVTTGDFLWIAPFCPQWFGCLGKVPAKYLIYKDSNRHPLA